MGSEEPESRPSRGKHHRSPAADDEAAESSKRRKHHRSPASDDEAAESSKRRKHHRHNHRHHRRHGKHGGERDGEEVLPPATEAGAEAASSALLKPDDDEREEGEILEEEEGGGDVRLELGRVSDVESGEIKPDAVDAVSNLARESVNHETLIRPCHYSSGKDDSKIEDLSIADGREASKNYGMKGEQFNGEIDIQETGTPLLNDEERETGSPGEGRHIQPELHTRGTEKGKKPRDVDADDSRSRARSKSPVSGESLHLTNHGRRNDHGTRDSDRNLERLELRQHLESWNASRKASDRNNRYKDPRCSPEARRSDRSRSRDHKRERSYERSLEPFADGNARVNHIDSPNNRVDWYAVRVRDSDKGVRKERERSNSHSRYDLQEDRHGSRERGSERDRYSSSVRDRDNEVVNKGVRRERERSSSCSRRAGRGDRHDSRDRGRDKEKYNSSVGNKDREKPRDTSRERYKERLRNANSEREWFKDRDERDRNQSNDRDHKERGGQMEKSRLSTRDRNRDSRHSKYDERELHKERTRLKEFAKDVNSKTPNIKGGKGEATRGENEGDYLERIEQQLAKQEEEDVDKIKEESRKRRQAILEKYKQQQMQQHANSPSSGHEKEEHVSTDKDNQQDLNAGNAGSQALHEDLENKHDPADVYVVGPSFTVGKSPTQNGASAPERTAGAGGLGEGTPKSERSADMFSDDIFGESPAGVRKSVKADSLQIDRSGLHDNWDDAEGYYSYRLGEVLDGRFEVKSFHGKGVFSTVVRAKDLKAGKGDPEEVAIKIIRNIDTMYKAGLEELVILKKLAGADPEDKRHCVRFLSSFKYRNHLCLVFESLHMNLREVLKKFGRNIGLNLTAVRAYAKQLFIALKHLKNCGVLHCDIKPDNMLVNEAKNVLKLCDFGNAMFAGKNEITPYLVSRFYRAPEIILGLPYDHPLDVWSVGCCLYELYTGKVLFPGPSNNDMLRLHMELKGPFPKKMLRKGAFTDQHFDQDLNFHATEEDPVTKKTVKRLLLSIKPKDIGALISSSLGEDPKMLANFKDLLERIFTLDPEKRMTVVQALSHPFITGK